jgi:hypothetical protein
VVMLQVPNSGKQMPENPATPGMPITRISTLPSPTFSSWVPAREGITSNTYCDRELVPV